MSFKLHNCLCLVLKKKKQKNPEVSIPVSNLSCDFWIVSRSKLFFLYYICILSVSGITVSSLVTL